MKAVVYGLLDLLAPHRCPGCDEALGPGTDGFCEVCAVGLEPARSTDGGRAAYVFGGPLADAIRRFKYGRRSELATPLGLRLAEAAVRLAGEVDAVVPVPLHPRRLRERGFDQAALLAGPVAHALAVPRMTGVLRRVRDTRPQASLDMAVRAANVRGAFVVRGAPPPRVLLVDDVRTTGATLAECAERLRAAGARRVHPLVLARAEP
ncbi:MAG TPA: ComF family protein [Sandaracinaceae bacterium LLY-WYZ-13_1]|nr:ComF family protein [Sandaracinaceae bacterium LLY-WYZ-13_1]